MIIIIPIGLIISLIRMCIVCCRQKARERALRRQEELAVDAAERGPLLQEEPHPVYVPQYGHDSFVQPSTVPEYPQSVNDKPPNYYN